MLSRSLTIVVAGLALLGLARPASAQLAPGRPSGESELARPPAALTEAIKVDERLGATVPLDARFRGADGRPATLRAVLAGDLPTLLTFNYSSCPSLCSLQLNGLVKALAASRFVLGRQVRLVTIVLAPDEAPADAARTREHYLDQLAALGAKVDPGGWTFLVAEQPDDDRQIHRVAEAVGFGYRYIETQREYAHPATTIALAPSGVVTRYVHGVDVVADELDETITRAGLAEPSTATGFVMACLHWDAKANSHRWGGTVMKFAALMFLVLGAIAAGVLVARNGRRPGVKP